MKRLALHIIATAAVSAVGLYAVWVERPALATFALVLLTISAVLGDVLGYMVRRVKVEVEKLEAAIRSTP